MLIDTENVSWSWPIQPLTFTKTLADTTRSDDITTIPNNACVKISVCRCKRHVNYDIYLLRTEYRTRYVVYDVRFGSKILRDGMPFERYICWVCLLPDTLLLSFACFGYFYSVASMCLCRIRI